MAVSSGTPLILVATLSLVISCGTSSSGDNLLTSQPQWEWHSACCGFAGDTKNPSTEGYIYVLQFHPNGRVRATRDDDLVIETGYRVTRSPGGPTADPAVTVVYDSPLPLDPGIEPATAHLVVLLETGTLLLQNLSPCADCYREWRFLPRLAQ
ncbi:MAG TPA: hypothetical protein VGA78_15280 [Gemmatimonadales bacterium]